MRIFKRTLSMLLALVMLVAMIPNVLAESDKIFTIQNDYIKYSINSETGGFSVETLDGNPQKELDNNIPLLYKEDESRSNGTSFTTIRIDGKDYIFGRSYGFFGIDTELHTPIVSEEGRLITVEWKIKDYLVTQKVALSAEKDNDLTGNVGISYTVKNMGSSNAPVGIRVLMDSALDSTIDSPYLIKDTDTMPINVETEYTADNMPTQIRGVDSLENPTKMMYTFLKGLNTKTPIDRVIVGHWRNLANTRYDYTPDNYCNFTNYSNKYRFPDSAIAYYWNETALSAGAEKTAELLYGVGNFSSSVSEENLGIYMSVDNKIRLNDKGNGYANDGEFEVTVTIDNSVDGAQKITDPVVEINMDDGIVLQEGQSSLTTYKTIDVGTVNTIKYKLKAEPQAQISAKMIAVSLHGSQDISAEKAKAVNYGTSRSVLLPSVSGVLPKISMNAITPETVYTEGTKTITVSGDMSELQALNATDMWELYLVHTTSDSKVRIEKDKFAFIDDKYSAFTCSTNEPLEVGEYQVVFEFTDTQLTEQFGVTSITAGKNLRVSNDPKYAIRSYGIMALVRHDKNKYSFVPFVSDDDYEKFLTGETDAVDIHNKAVPKHNYVSTVLADNEIIMIIRGDIQEAQEKVDGEIKTYYQASAENSDVIINDILSYKGSQPLVIKDYDGVYKVSGDGKLSIIDSIEVWRGKWFFQTMNNQVTSLDSDNFGADCTQLKLSLEGLGHVVQSIGGFLIDISFGVMSASRSIEDDKHIEYGIGFGGRISIPIKASDEKDKSKDQLLSSDDSKISKDKVVDSDDYSDALGNLFKEEDGWETGKNEFKKDTSLDNGGLTADIKEVRFGQNVKVNDDGTVEIESVGFKGINTTLTLCLPKDVLGKLVSNAPGVYAAVTINTLDDIYAIAAGLDIKAIQCEGLLSFKKTDVRGTDVILPDNIEFYIRDGISIPIVPGVLSIAGLGGGINDLADTLGGEFTTLPPLTILLYTRLKAIELLIGDFDASVNLSGIELSGELSIDTRKTLKSPVVINAGLSAKWVDPIQFKVYGTVNVIDGIIRGGITITITDKSFCGYAFVTVCVPESIPIIGGREMARLEAAVSNDYIGTAFKILGIKFGIIYYWNGDFSFGQDISLTGFDDEINPENMDALIKTDTNNGETHTLYGTNIRKLDGKAVNNTNNGEVSLMDTGTNVTYNFNVKDEDAVIFEIPFTGYTIPDIADIKLTNPNGTEIPLALADDEGNGNFLVQTAREDGNFIYISVTDKSYLANGNWTITVNNSNTGVTAFSCYAVDNIAELSDVRASYTSPYTLDVAWTTDCEAASSGYIDVYLTKDKDIMSKVRTSDADDTIGEHIGRVRVESVKNGNETFTIPDSMSGGNYYAVATLSTDSGGMSTAVASTPFTFTNANLPKPVKSADVRYGGNGDIYVDIKDADDADYTHYLVSVLSSDGTALIMDQFKKGEKVFIGKEAGLNANSDYYVEVKTLREDDGKFYYGDDDVKSSTIKIPELDKPVLLSVETNIPENGIINEGTFEATYTFDRPVWFLGDINGNLMSERCFKEVWQVSYPLHDGDYLVDFEAIGMNKDYVKASDFKDTVENALIGFKSDTIAPVLSLKKNILESAKKENNQSVKTAFATNTVVADENGNFVVEGISEPNAVLTVDGSADGIVRKSNGVSFTYSANLGDASQRTMEIKAVDKAGNTSTLVVYAVINKQSAISSIEILNNGESIAKNGNGDSFIEMRKGQTANLTINGVTQDGEKVEIANSDVLWDVLFEKNLVKLENGVVTAVGAGETAVKVGMSGGEVTLLDNSKTETAVEDYVLITVFAYSKDDLAAEIAKAETNIQTPKNATEDDIAVYQTAINSAKSVYDDTNAKDADIEKAVASLKNATEIFNKAKNRVSDKTVLKAEIDSAEKNIAAVGNANADDVTAYQTAIASAKTVYNNDGALQTEVDSAAEALKNATKAFNEKKNAGTDKTALAEEIINAKSNIAVVGSASADDVAEYQTAIDKAETVYVNPDATQAETDKAVEELKSATDKFNKKKNNNVDKTKLADEIEIAQTNIANVNKASKSDIEKYQSAIDKAQAIYDKSDATQTEVNKAVSELSSATKAFDKKNNPSSPSGGSGGGGGGVVIGINNNVTYYDVTVSASEGGSAAISQQRVPSGNSVTITAVPNEGYEVDKIMVNGKYCGKAEISTIAAVTENTNITVTFAEKWFNPFSDISNSDWFYENVKWANRNGLMNGTDENIFSPNSDITRAMLVTILYRTEDEPDTNGVSKFNDVDSLAYYNNAVIWAEQNGIVKGYSDTEFAPNDNITREQMAAIVYRYAKLKGYNTDVKGEPEYSDRNEISDYAKDAVIWCLDKGIMKGNENNTFAPNKNTTRAESAAVLERFSENNN